MPFRCHDQNLNFDGNVFMVVRCTLSLMSSKYDLLLSFPRRTLRSAIEYTTGVSCPTPGSYTIATDWATFLYIAGWRFVSSSSVLTAVARDGIEIRLLCIYEVDHKFQHQSFTGLAADPNLF